MDDYRIFLRSCADPDEVIEVVRFHLSLIDSALNESKTRVRHLGGSGDVSDAPEIAYGPPESLQALAARGIASGMTRALGHLRYTQSPTGIDVILDEPMVLDRFPKETVQYLSAVREQITAEQWERFTDRVARPVTQVNAAAQIHVARLLRHHRLGKAPGGSVFELAADLDGRRYGPTKASLLALAGSSAERPAVRRRRAIEFADSTNDLDLMRGALMACHRSGGIDASTKAGLRHLGRSHLGLRPMVEMLLDDAA